MTTRKVILFSLILPVLYSVLFLKGQSDGDMSERAILIVIAFAFWGAGLLAAVILTVIFKKPKVEPYFYLGTQLILPLTLFGYSIASDLRQAKHDRDFGNMDANHDLLDIRNPWLSPNLQHIRTAFTKLESTFSNPNSLILTRYRSYWGDTLIGGTQDTVYSVYFTYLKDKKPHFAKVKVIGDNAVIDSLDMPGGSVRVYPGRHLIVRGGSLDNLADVKRVLQDEPKWVRDTAISILSR